MKRDQRNEGTASVVDRHGFDADPDPDPHPTPSFTHVGNLKKKKNYFYSHQCRSTLSYRSRQRHKVS